MENTNRIFRIIKRWIDVNRGFREIRIDQNNRRIKSKNFKGQVSMEYEILIKNEIEPYSINLPRPVLKYQQSIIFKLGIIEEATGPTNWCSPLVIAFKGNGKIRICSDMNT